MLLNTHEWEKQCKSIHINHLLVLCEIVEEYKSFCNDLEILIKSRTNRDLVSEAYKVMQGKFSIHSRRYKSFIEKHKHTIEIMNKYSCLSNLTVLNYNTKGSRIANLPVDYFYEYIQNNKEYIEVIKAVALKLKTLGFREIQYGESLDFTKTEYNLYPSRERTFAYLENIEVNPTYLNNPIKYKTSDSCYCMCLDLKCYGNEKEISEYSRKIYLNSLILEPNSLPNEITMESTIGVIKKLAADRKIEYQVIGNSVDLSIAINDLKNEFEHIKQVIAKIDKVKDDEELISLLAQMQNIMTQLQSFGENFEKEIIDCNENITEQKMEQEKKLYLERRYLSSIHID